MFTEELKIFNLRNILGIIFCLTIIFAHPNYSYASDGGGIAPSAVQKLPEAPHVFIEQPEKISKLPAPDKPHITQKNDLKEKFKKPGIIKQPKPLPSHPSPNILVNVLASLVKLISFLAILILIFLLIKNYKEGAKQVQEQEIKEIAEPETVSEAVTTFVKHRIE